MKKILSILLLIPSLVFAGPINEGPIQGGGGGGSSYSFTLPLTLGGSTISINPATDSLPGSMSAADKTKLDAYPTYVGPYLPLAGGTMTGSITWFASQTWPTFNQDTTGSAVYWKTSGTGKAAIAGPGTGQTRTYTFPDADTTFSGSTISDYQYIPVEAGVDSVLNTPDVSIRLQGAVGSNIVGSPTNVSYGTFTTSGANVTNAVWGSSTQTGTFTLTGLTSGKLYRLQFTPTVTGQVPTITTTSGISSSNIPTVVTATVENIYFRTSATTAVFTFTNTATSTWSTASTTVYEYSRSAMIREFSNSIQQTLSFDWMPPSDWNGGTIAIQPTMVVSNATAPANGETVIWSFAGFAIGSSDSLSQALGTAQTSTFTADATYLQYDEAIGPASATITLGNSPASGKKVRLIIDRLTTGTYAQKIGLTGIQIKFTRTLAP